MNIKRALQSDVFVAGLAMFSMFFGAGNIVFPLIIGCISGDKTVYALMGFLITAVGLPVLGVVGNVLFEGDYKKFFYRMGMFPGLFFILVILAIIGPFGAIPRCITLSHAALKMYVPSVSLFIFSLAAVVVIFYFARSKSRLLDVLGYVLTPLKLSLFGLIIIKGLLYKGNPVHVTTDMSSLFGFGFMQGYNTLDLLGGIFFSSIVLDALMKNDTPKDSRAFKRIALVTLKGGVIGAVLLGMIYAGLSVVAAMQGALLKNVAPDELLTVIAYNILGPTLGIISSAAVSVACLATAIALATVFADYLHNELFSKKVCYRSSLLITLLITFVFANLGFSGIMKFLVPVLTVGYPALIVLTIMNIAHKLFDVQVVKIPVFATLIASLLLYLRY